MKGIEASVLANIKFNIIYIMRSYVFWIWSHDFFIDPLNAAVYQTPLAPG